MKITLAIIIGSGLWAQTVDQIPTAGGAMTEEVRRQRINQNFSALDNRTTLLGYGQGANVLAYGAKGDGTTNDTSAIQAAIDAVSSTLGGTVIFPPSASCYKTGTLTVSSKAHLRLIGMGGILCLTGTGTGAPSGYIGIKLDGVTSDFTMDGLLIAGSGVAADNHAGVWVNAAATLSNIRYLRNTINGVVVGLAVSNASASSVDGFEVAGNRLSNIVGTASGQGYGIQAGTGGVDGHGSVHDNYISTGQRHDIYVSNGSDVSVVRNHSKSHRTGQSTPASPLPAIVVARSQNVLVAENIVEAAQDGCISVSPGTGGTQPARNVIVKANICTGSVGTFPALTIGSQTPATDDDTSDILVTENQFYQSITVPTIGIYSGKRITQANNNHVMLSASGTNYFVDVFGLGESGASATYTDSLKFVNNQYYATGGTISAVGIRTAAAGSAIGMQFSGNRGTLTGNHFWLESTLTDANVSLSDNPTTGMTSTLTTNYGPSTFGQLPSDYTGAVKANGPASGYTGFGFQAAGVGKGSIVWSSGTNAVTTYDSGGNTVMSVAVDGTGAVTIPAVKSTTGTRYVCADTAGKLVSSTTACSGT